MWQRSADSCLVITHKSGLLWLPVFTLPLVDSTILYDFFVGGSTPSFSECDGEGDRHPVFTLPAGSLRLASDPPAIAFFPMDCFAREGEEAVATKSCERHVGKDKVPTGQSRRVQWEPDLR